MKAQRDPFSAMKIYSSKNVFEAALDRIRWLFDEFPNVVVGYSGGKDSTIIYNLVMMVARERGRLPLKVLFIDQEVEWQATIDQVRRVMTDPDVEPLWLQIPYKITNSVTASDHWLHCWAPDAEKLWMRPKEPTAITDASFTGNAGEDRFGQLIEKFLWWRYPDVRTVNIAGIRCEESPARAQGLTHWPSYKWATWGAQVKVPKDLAPNHRPITATHTRMYPIYDWSTSDVWVAIQRHGWPYNSIYDVMHTNRVPVHQMRVSELLEVTSSNHLFYLQEAEPETYDRMVARVPGIDTAGKVGHADYFPKQLPFMFRSWAEYRDFLLDKLVADDQRERFRDKFAKTDDQYAEALGDSLRRTQVSTILTDDCEFIKLNNLDGTLGARLARRRERGEAIYDEKSVRKARP